MLMAERVSRLHTEEECAQLGNYTYICSNTITKTFINEHQVKITKHFDKKQALGKQSCTCVVKNGKKCIDKNCTNRQLDIACPESCGKECHNNPWANDGFIIGKKTYAAETTGKGLGIFANEAIGTGEFVGEYTGIVRRDTATLSTNARCYTMAIPYTNDMIDSYRFGSACRLLNHSCRPNCEYKMYVHKYRLKIVVKVIRPIAIDGELTVDYGKKYNDGRPKMVCLCGLKDYCTGFVGEGKNVTRGEISDEATSGSDTVQAREPIEFASYLNNRDRTGQKSRNRRTAEPIRPAHYVEDHVFAGMDPAYALTFRNGNMRIIFGQVIECFFSVGKIPIYGLRSIANGVADYYVPRWILFHHHADALYSWRKDYTDDEKEEIKRLTRLPSRDAAKKVRAPCLRDYEAKFKAGKNLALVMNRNTFGGGPAIGVSEFVLTTVADHAREMEGLSGAESDSSNESINQQLDEINDMEQRTGFRNKIVINMKKSSDGKWTSTLKGRSKKQTGRKTVYSTGGGPSSSSNNKASKKIHTQQHSFALVEREIHQRLLDGGAYGPIPGQETSEDGAINDDDPDLVSTDACSDEDADHNEQRACGNDPGPTPRHQSVDDVKKSNKKRLQLRRLFYIALEQVCMFVLSRYRKNEGPAFETIRTEVRTILEENYYHSVAKARRFLHINHYRLSCDIHAPGAWNMHWCSLCRKKWTFSNENSLRRHYNKYHALVVLSYACPKCLQTKRYPSTFRRHVKTCDRDFAETLLWNINPRVMDAFADFAACRQHGNNATLYLLEPGPIHMCQFKKPNKQTSKHGRKTYSPSVEIDMDPITLKPVLPEIDMPEPVKFKKVMKDTTEITSWADLKPSRNRDAAPKFLIFNDVSLDDSGSSPGNDDNGGGGSSSSSGPSPPPRGPSPGIQKKKNTGRKTVSKKKCIKPVESDHDSEYEDIPEDDQPGPSNAGKKKPQSKPTEDKPKSKKKAAKPCEPTTPAKTRSKTKQQLQKEEDAMDEEDAMNEDPTNNEDTIYVDCDRSSDEDYDPTNKNRKNSRPRK